MAPHRQTVRRPGGSYIVAARPPDDEAESVLNDREPPPFTVENPDGASPIVLACDHASNLVPRALKGLGLVERELHRHIAWDQGAAEVTRGLSERLDATAVLAGYSRLVIDCNRSPEHETSIAETSDGTTVPGNVGISEEARMARKRALFDPYHDALAGALDRVRGRGRMPVLVAVHSFTPVLAGEPRPWQISVLWGYDPRVPVPLLAALRRRGDLEVGDNQPYSGRNRHGHTIKVHGSQTGTPHALIEIRADQVADSNGASRYVDILAGALQTVLTQLPAG